MDSMEKCMERILEESVTLEGLNVSDNSKTI